MKIQKTNNQRFGNKLTLFCLFLTLIVLSVSFVEAQTKKKKSGTVRNPSPSVPTQTVGVFQPEVVSRAGEEQNFETPPSNSSETPNNPVQTPETIEEKLDKLNEQIRKIGSKVNSIESQQKNDAEAKQRKLLLNLDILTRAEQRAESLRKQLFELVEKENEIKKRLEEADYNARPDVIERQTNLIGSLRPEELREARRKTLETEKNNMAELLRQLQSSKLTLEDNISKADLLVEKIRLKLEKEIENALLDEEPEK